MSFSSNFPTIAPSLNLDFANTKVLDPRITLTRASTATFYDGLTVAKAEENLFVQSQTFENASWVVTNSTITSNTSTAPDGTTTAETITASAGTGQHLVRQDTSAIGTLTASVFAKAGTHNFLQIFHGNSANYFADFDLSGGTVGTTGASTTASIVSIGSGWYRCIITFTTAANSAIRFAIVSSSSAVYNESWTAVGTETVLLWGAQLEQRSAVTAYTATTTQPITNYIPALRTAAAGVARYDHNPTTGESLGLLIEEQRANLVLQSENPTVSPWAASTAGTSTRVLSGWNIGFNVFEITATSASGGIRQPISGLSSGQVYALSFYMQSSATSIVLVLENGVAAYGTQCSVLINGATGAISSVAGFTSTSSTAFGNGYLYTFVLPAAGGALTANIELRINTSGQRIFLGRPQFEAGAFATSYIPTVASSVTRAADNATITGTNFSSWYRPDEGTLYLEGTANTTGYSASINNNSSSNAITLVSGTSGTAFWVDVSGVSQAAIGTRSLSMRYAGAYKANDIAFSSAGGVVATDTTATIPVVSQLNIGTRSGGSGPISGTIKKLAYYPWRLTNAQLQALTS